MEKNFPRIKNINNYIHSLLYKKYFRSVDVNNIFLINKIIFNESCHLVAEFKEFLIYEDNTEFLKYYYLLNQSFKKLKRFLNYYEKYSIYYPNYIILHESKYLYRNIIKKQRIIENYQNKKKEIKNYTKNNEEGNKKNNNDKIIFNSTVYNSILKNSENDGISIFGLSNKFNKDESKEDYSSISHIEDIITNIDKNEKEKEKRKKNIKIKNVNIPININNYKIKNYNNILKRNINHTNTNNTNSILLKTNKSNSLKHNNSNKENNIIVKNEKGNMLINYKTLLIEKKTNCLKSYKYKSKIINNNINNSTNSLKINSSVNNSILSFKKSNIYKKIIKTKIYEKLGKTNNIPNLEIQFNNFQKLNIKKGNKNIGLRKKLRNKIINIDEKKYKFSIYNTFNTVNGNNIMNNKKITFIEPKKCFSEKKLFKNKSIQTTRNKNLKNNKQANMKLLNFINSSKTYRSFIEKKHAMNNIFTSSIFIKIPKAHSNNKKKIKEKCDNNYIHKNKSIKYLKAFNCNSSSIEDKKNKFNKKEPQNHVDKNYIKKIKDIIKRNIFTNKKLFISNSYFKKDDKNKRDSKIANIKGKLDINNVLNLRNKTFLNKSNKNINISNEIKKIQNLSKINNKQKIELKKRKQIYLLKDNQLNTINGFDEIKKIIKIKNNKKF